MKKFLKLGCGGVVALFVLLVIIGILTSNSNSATKNSPDGIPAKPTAITAAKSQPVAEVKATEVPKSAATPVAKTAAKPTSTPFPPVPTVPPIELTVEAGLKASYQPITTYRKAGINWKNILVKSGTTRDQLIEIARYIHRIDPFNSYNIFDDDVQFQRFMLWDLNYPDPMYPFPEEWTKAHLLGGIKQDGESKEWELTNWMGLLITDLK